MRFTSKDNKEFSKLRKAFNRKIKRLEEQGQKAPAKIYKEDIKGFTRRDYNILKKEMKDFIKRGSEKQVLYDNLVMTEYEKKKLIRAKISYQVKKHYEKKNLSSMDIKRLEEQNIRDIKYFKNNEKLHKFIVKHYYDRNIDMLNEKYKNNYLKTLENHGYLDTELYKILQNTSATKVFNALKYSPTFDISFVYSAYQKKSQLDILTQEWKNYLGV